MQYLEAKSLGPLIVTPLLLFIVALQEGRRNGVIIGVLVAASMGIATFIGPSREDLLLSGFADTRIAAPTFITMLVYVVLVNTWTGQQEQLKDAELQAMMLQEQANCDLDTGLLNCKGLGLVAHGWVHRGQPFSVFALRLDNMGPSDADAIGSHQNELIVSLAKFVHDELHEPVTLARWDVSTLLMLSHLADRRSVEQLAQHVRRLASDMPRETPVQYTASVGFSILLQEENFELAVRRAQLALADAQGHGNCVRSRLA